MNKIKPFAIKLEDKVYLKHEFKRYFSTQDLLLYTPEMDRFKGKQVLIKSLHVTHSFKAPYNPIDDHFTFVCRIANKNLNLGDIEVRLPIVCIDRSQPLIRDNRKVMLKNKQLYFLVPA